MKQILIIYITLHINTYKAVKKSNAVCIQTVSACDKILL